MIGQINKVATLVCKKKWHLALLKSNYRSVCLMLRAKVKLNSQIYSWKAIRNIFDRERQRFLFLFGFEILL